MDAQWTVARVWVDADSDGITDAGELKTFAELGITRIDVAARRQSGEIRDGNEILARGTYVRSGSTLEALAVNFLADPLGTTSTSGNVIRREGDAQSTYVVSNSAGETVNLATLPGQPVRSALGGSGDDSLTGDDADNWLAGGLGSDTLVGGAGDDVLLVDASDNLGVLRGGTGLDVVKAIGVAGVSINLWQTEVEIFEGGRGDDYVVGGGLTNVFVRGGEGNDLLVGGKADDALSGESGNDIVDGWDGDDLLRGHGGTDVLVGADGNDVLRGGLDDDLLLGGAGNDVLRGDQGNDTLDGGDGIDVAEFSGSYADYRLYRSPDGALLVRDLKSGRDGLDRLTGIEKISFADISSIELTLPNPLLVNDIVTLTGAGEQTISAGQLLGNDLDWQGDALHITWVGDVRGGTALLQGDGSVLFTPDAAYGGVRGFRYKVADASNNPGANVVEVATGASAEMKGSVHLLTPDMPTDPLLAEQWYLTDTNVIPVWKDYTGKGIKVGLFEPGGEFAVGSEIFDYRHPDLAASVDPAFLASPDAIETFSTHGTLVAGIIAAERNGEGGVGVAYDAELSGFALAVDELDALNRMFEFDIANNSWTASPNFVANFRTNEALKNTFISATQNGRDGLGTIIVFAGGNERADGGNTNHQSIHNNRFEITVGAVNVQSDLGALILGQAPFSNPGATILVSAPGSNVASTSRLLLTDNGAVFGSDNTVAQGTSFAAPLVSGVVALMLEANPNLGYRDVQDILTLSARNVDAANPGWSWNDARSWNGGAMRVSHDYGYGQVDARAAVRLAETWVGQQIWINEYQTVGQLSGTLNAAIPDGSGSLVRSFTLSAVDALTVEYASVRLQMTHQNLGDVVVTLVGPGGTESILLDRPGKAPGSGVGDLGDGAITLDFDLGSMRHRGETSVGQWQLRIEDKASGNTGTLTAWELQLFGKSVSSGASASSGDDVYVYTDEFASLSGSERVTLIDTAGFDVVNAAALTNGAIINLNSGASSTIAGRAMTISATSIIEDAVGGDGNDTLTGNGQGNRLVGGRGADILSGGDGSDLLDGGRGSDVLTGGADKDLFLVRWDADASAPNPVTDQITDFSAAAGERIGVVGFPSVSSFAQLQIVQEGANTRVNIDPAHSILLVNVSAASITAANFAFLNEINASAVLLGTSGADTQPTLTAPGARPVVIMAGAGNDTALGSNNGDTILGEDGADVLVGENNSDQTTGGNDTIFGGAGDDVIFGGPGDDTLYRGDGLDYVQGDAGNDIIYLDGDEFGVVQNAVLPPGTGAAVYGGTGGDRFIVLPGDASSTGGGLLRNMIGDFEVANPDEKIDFRAFTSIHSMDDLAHQNMIVGQITALRIWIGTPFTSYVTLLNRTWDQLSDANFLFSPQLNYVGTSGADTVVGDAGGTTLDGGAGADRMEGRTGDDTYVVDNVGDVVVELVGGGFDIVRSSVSYSLPGEVENLVLTGTANVNATGNEQNNRITGNSGDNRLDGGQGIDSLAGGAGNDTYVVDNTADTVVEVIGAGTDTVESSATYNLGEFVENLILTGSDSIDGTGNSADNSITGNDGGNVLFGAEGNDTLVGGAGNDTLDGGSGTNSLAGGTGDDAYMVRTLADAVTEGVAEGIDTIFSDISLTLPGNVEILYLSTTASNATGTGNSLDNSLFGNSGANILTGNDGNDLLSGGAGGDTLSGGAGTDVAIYSSSTAGVSVNLATGAASGGDAQGDTLSGIEGLIGSNFNDSLTGSTVANVLRGLGGDDTLSGNDGDDELWGEDGGDTLYGGLGADRIDAGEGNDFLYGEAGDDLLAGGMGADRLEGGDGNDTTTYAFSASGVTVSLTTGAGSGGDAQADTLVTIENLVGSIFADYLTGNSGANRLDGAAGNDQIDGGDGDDTLVGGTGDDTLVGGSGTDTASYAGATSAVTVTLATTLAQNTGSAGADILTGIENLLGSALDDVLTGSSGANRLEGGDGNDLLAGGAGADILIGGAGTDVASYAGAGAAITLSLLAGTASGSDAAGDTFSSIEDVVGSAYNDDITGSAATNTLRGGDGGDILRGDAGTDQLFGENADDIINGGAGGDYIDGGAGGDQASYFGSSGAVIVSLAAATAVGGFATGDVLVAIEHLKGSSYNDTLTGNSVANDLYGQDGNDTLVGLEGSDRLYGENGSDSLEGGSGDDLLDGGAGTDVARYVGAGAGVSVSLELTTAQDTGGAGLDTLAGIENLVGSAFADTLTGNSGANTLEGGDGNDTLTGGLGDDRLDGGSGVDTASYANATLQVRVILGTGGSVDTINYGRDTFVSIENVIGGSANDQINGDDLANRFEGRGGTDTLQGLGGNDVLIGGADFDQIYGGDGDDLLEGGEGDDRLEGNAGTDTATYASASAGITADLSNVNWQNTVGAGVDIFVDVENLVGSAFADALTGSAAANILDGSSGNDNLVGNDGDDVLIGGAGADTLNGGTGMDTASYALAAAAVTLNLSTGTASGSDAAGDTFNSIENIIGSAYADDFTGSTASNVIRGGDGSDILRGDVGDDQMFGEAGDDVINGGAGADLVDGGTGIDQANYYGSTAGVTVNLSTGIVSGGFAAGDILVSIENVRGSSYADSLTGDGAANDLFGFENHDTLIGLGGNDRLYGDTGNDTLEGGDGDDLLDGGVGTDIARYSSATAAVSVSLDLTGAQNTIGAGTDTLTGMESLQGSSFADTLTGNSSGNSLDGGDGDDVLIGKGGADTLTGGNGADIFRYTALSDSTSGMQDIITAFSSAASDKIDVSLIDPSASAGDQAFAFVGSAAFSGGGAAQLRTYQSGGNTYVEADTGDGVADMAIRVNGLVTFSASDFLL